MTERSRQRLLLVGLGGVVVGFALMVGLNSLYIKSSSNETCMACHHHPHAEASWRQSVHYDNGSGAITDCADCHLPPEGTPGRFFIKARMGLKDIWSAIVHKPEDINWIAKGELEHATKTVYDESCLKCHVNLYPQGISDDGIIGHLYYEQNADKLGQQCISCHLDAGHYNPNYHHSAMTGVPISVGDQQTYAQAATVETFENFTETVPGTIAAIDMIAIPGGTFTMGSPESEPLRGEDEGPQRRVTVSDFWMSEVEVTWDQYWSFYSETMSEGHTPPEVVKANNSRPDVDAVSGPTPPFGSPDQGWGMGERPAITMTWYAAQTFCQWLTLKTGRTYRLPTEAEWEYAARAGSQDAYSFTDKSPRKYSSKPWIRHIFKPDTTGLASLAIYERNSNGMTAEPSEVRANAFGLKNMYGNVMEYCSDRYQPNAYEGLEDGVVDPKGPSSGREHVVRGGCYADDAAQMRSAARGSTHHNDWLKTDPQDPKSIWWYSDIKGIGFRVVCEVPDGLKK